MAKMDEEAYRERLARMTSLFADMVNHADEVSRHRCPYRDRHDHCTAKIRCRNQKRPGADGEPLLCLHDGSLDYRNAWESDPDTYDRAKKKLSRVKDAAADRRARKQD